jgi:hypothetical protein
MFGDRTCKYRADVIQHTVTFKKFTWCQLESWCNAREKWRIDRMRIKLIGKVVRLMCHEEIVITVHGLQFRVRRYY